MSRTDFAVFILTHGRPDNVVTHDTLRRQGYTGPIYLIVDNLDKTINQYKANFGEQNVIIFDKEAIAKTFDQGDNCNDMRAIVYARNASFQIAKDLGLKYFLQLDDDYTQFAFRFDDNLEYFPPTKQIKNMDKVFEIMLRFFEKSGAHTIAFAQGGDFIGGFNSSTASSPSLKRKCMNSFFCSTERPFQFIGRLNEDVSTYTRQASTGLLMLTVTHVALVQKSTQSTAGGMTEIYREYSSHVKPFSSILFHPSSIKIRMLNGENKRLHHGITWNNTVPKILDPKHKKGRKP